MIPTPTNADHPSRLYKDMKANTIWNVPEIRINPYVQKSCSLVASTDIRETISPVDCPCPSFDSRRAFW